MLPEFQEFETVLKEATSAVEQSLAITGWTQLGNSNMSDLTGASRAEYLRKSRYMYNFDPLAKQAIRLWTDYTFGSGISWQSEDEVIKTALKKFWDNPKNRSVLSAKGQRKSSDKALVDGEVFFALFLGADGEVTIRWIDPLEITEIITDPDDIESVRYFRRDWTNTQNVSQVSYYRSNQNIDDTAAPDSMGASITSTEDAIVYHVAINSIGQRGNPLLLPVIGWIEQYRLFLAARIAIVRALARFAWMAKTKGGSSAVATVKAATEGKYPQAGSTAVTNEAVTLDPIKTDTGSANAKDDGRMLKLQICAGVGLFEQYFGDVSIGSLATARTVELPMLKQFGSYQQIWADVYLDIFNIVLDHNGVKEEDRFVDFDMPEIALADQQAALASIQSLVAAFPDVADAPAVLKQALINIGLNNVDEILDELEELQKEKDKLKAETLANMPPEMQNQAGKPPMGPDGQPVAGQPPVAPVQPSVRESAEVRAIKALREIRQSITLKEFNDQHDPENGQFTGDGGGSGASKAEKDYDAVNNEGGEGYNPYRQERLRQEQAIGTGRERTAPDSAETVASGNITDEQRTANQAEYDKKVSDFQKSITYQSELRQVQINSAKRWPKEKTKQNRELFNKRSQELGLNSNDLLHGGSERLHNLEKEIGFTVDQLQAAKAVHKL